MRGISVDEMDNLKLKELIKLKTSIQNRISDYGRRSVRRKREIKEIKNRRKEGEINNTNK